MSVRSRFLVPASLLAAGLITAAATGQSLSAAVPKTYASTLTPAQIAAYSQNATNRVIIVMANQHPDLPGVVDGAAASSALSSRSAALASDQAPIVDELEAVNATTYHQYSFINAISATVSKDEAAHLATDPGVSAVVPDTQVQGPSSSTDLVPTLASSGSGTPTTPAAGVCPSDPTKPILEPEALQLMNVDFGPGSTQPAAHNYVTGTGVKIAVFPDGLDPTIPDFMRKGKSAIFDYQDFSGEGANAVTGGEEAFGDASSLIAQGTHTYDLSKEVNAAHALPAGCNIRVEGVSPGSNVAVMKVFGNANLAFNSVILQGMDWAVSHDHVDIMSQSFGGNPVPNAGADPIAVFDADAVAAGVTVVASSGDAGFTNTIGSPATNPAVISVGATTSYREYAQTGSYGYQFGTGGWNSDQISSPSSSGVTDLTNQTINLVAPGENGWADCSHKVKIYTECADQFGGSTPQALVAFGGTSEACPLTAGTAALVIEAYRNTHNGATPSPALVKQILMSSATDLSAPGALQGAGLVNALRAVQTAMSLKDTNGSPTSAGQGLVYSTNSISQIANPSTSSSNQVTVTNTGSSSVTLSSALRSLGALSSITSGTLTLTPTTDPTFIYQTGQKLGDVHLVTFKVPNGTQFIESRLAWFTASQAEAAQTVRETLFDPSGKITAQSRPQGNGGGYGQVNVDNPAPGTWTLLVFTSTSPGYQGPLAYSVLKANYANVAGAVTPATQTIPAGASATYRVNTTTPSSPGDLAESVTFSSPQNTGWALATIPVTLRSLVAVAQNQGSFSGTMTSGNERMAFYGQEIPYMFNVPKGLNSIDVNVSIGTPGYQVLGFLVDPSGQPVDIQSTLYTDPTSGNTSNLNTLHLSWATPTPGLWSLDLTQINAVSSVATQTSYKGSITFNGDITSETGLPQAADHLAAGQPTTATIRVINTTNSPEVYSVDPRLSTVGPMSIASLFPTSGTMPISTSTTTIPQFIVPPYSTSVSLVATSPVAVDFDTSPAFGTPDVLSSTGTTATATYSGEVPASEWSCTPVEQGPALSVSEPFSCSGDATTNLFDPAVSSDTGNIWSALEGLTNTYSPLVLKPGQSGTITVTITPSGPTGSLVSGFLALETFNPNTVSSDILTTFPYAYRIH